MGYLLNLTNLEGRPVLVAGAGEIAAQKTKPLLEAGALVHIVAPHLGASIKAMKEQLHGIAQRAVQTSDLDGKVLVIAATDDTQVNRDLAKEARARGILINVADDPAYCDFYSPAVVQRGPVRIAVSTDGASPLLAAQVRRFLEAALPKSLGAVGRFFTQARAKGLRGLARRERLLSALTDPKLTKLVDRGAGEQAADRLQRIANSPEESFKAGTVAIVGAGPGDPELLTQRAINRILRADVILHDALVPPAILELAMPNTRLVNVGRRAKGERVPFEFAVRLLLQEASSARRVVRLHAGDPFVFGRGAEEVSALVEAGIGHEVVPGVSAVIAAPASVQVPLTERGVARGFSVRTGHTAQGPHSGGLPVSEETVVVLMGLGNIESIMKGLIDEGRAPSTPACAVSNATRKEERAVFGTLSTLAARVAEAQLPGPATLIVGETVRRGLEKVSVKESAA